MNALSEDRFLGGRLIVRQPANGFRAGLDAVMLAAALPGEGGEALELGAGVGTASLCLAQRGKARIIGLELDAELVEIAATNAEINALTGRVSFVSGDVFDPPTALKREFDCVFCNPPFHGDGQVSPEPARARAKMDGGRLGDWLAAGLRRTRSGGVFAAILRADRIGEALAALPEVGIGILPLWPRADEPAKRVIVLVRKGARHPLALHPGLTLHAADGSYTPAADAILRGEAALDY